MYHTDLLLALAALHLPEGVQGTALYSLQSCMNHSQDPNARAMKEDYDMDGRAVICAVRDIAPGEEVCISYIDLSAPESEQRQALLDYGIRLQ